MLDGLLLKISIMPKAQSFWTLNTGPASSLLRQSLLGGSGPIIRGDLKAGVTSEEVRWATGIGITAELGVD